MNAQKGAELPVGVTVKPLTPGIGCEIFGWDLRQPIGSAARDALLELFVERAVLVFREQTLDRERTKPLRVTSVSCTRTPVGAKPVAIRIYSKCRPMPTAY